MIWTTMVRCTDAQILYVVVAGDESGNTLECMERYSNSAMLGVSCCLLDERE